MTGHHILVIGSVILACNQAVITLLTGRRNRVGWLVSIANNVAGIVYDIATTQYGFVPVCCLNMILAARAYRAWGKKEKVITREP